MGVWQLQSLQYICAPFGPFVQGLGRQVFILETGVRFPYGLQKRHLPGCLFCAPLRTVSTQHTLQRLSQRSKGRFQGSADQPLAVVRVVHIDH
jgi:hypothetical protein